MINDRNTTDHESCREDLREQEALSGVAQVHSALVAEVERSGLGHLGTRIPKQLASHQMQTDPYDGSRTFAGEWRAESGARTGSVLIHQGGQVFAEFDILVPHPTDERWFVEAVTAWGTQAQLKSELRLLPALGA